MIKKKVKITYIVPSFNTGGAERFLLDLIESINKEEFEVSVIVFKVAGPLINELHDSNTNYFVLTKLAKFDLKNLWQVYKILKKIKPDIVHTQLGGDLVGRLAAILARVKIIVSTEQNVNKDESFFYILFKTITAFFAAEVVSISQAVQKESRKKYFFIASKYKNVIYNGVDTNKFVYLAKKNLNPQQIIVGAASRLVKQKGLDLLIKAWAEIRPNNARLIIGGDGADKTLLESLIKLYALETSVKLIGWPSSMPDFYHHLDLFVMPSRWEGLGISALEAAASGTPMLLSDADGLKEIAKQSETWVCEANSLTSLISTLRTALSQLKHPEIDEKRKFLRDKMVNNFSKQIIAVQYSNLYHNLLNQKK